MRGKIELRRLSCEHALFRFQINCDVKTGPQKVQVARQGEVDKVTIDLEMELCDRAVSRPLALHLFEHNKRRVERMLQETIAGGATVNDAILQIAPDS